MSDEIIDTNLLHHDQTNSDSQPPSAIEHLHDENVDDLLKRSYIKLSFFLRKTGDYLNNDLLIDIEKYLGFDPEPAPPVVSDDDVKSFSINDIKSQWAKDRSFVGCEWLLDKLRSFSK